MTNGWIDDLPPFYASLLRLHAEAVPADEIARRLDVPPESIALLLELAVRKMQRTATERDPR